MRFLFAFILMVGLAGCVSTSQDWVHTDVEQKGHVLVPGHIRWYQYNDLWFNNGGKPPAGLGGILCTLFSPGDWFWYGPYNLTPKEDFKVHYKIWCVGCKRGFESSVADIKKKEAQAASLKKEGRFEEARILQSQADWIRTHNCIGDDLETPFEKRF